MTDLNTNTYLYNQPYPQNQPGYGDNKTGLPISYDDKRLDPIKKDINDNFLMNLLATCLSGKSWNIWLSLC